MKKLVVILQSGLDKLITLSRYFLKKEDALILLNHFNGRHENIYFTNGF